jgi:hypothetical protein
METGDLILKDSPWQTQVSVFDRSRDITKDEAATSTECLEEIDNLIFMQTNTTCM